MEKQRKVGIVACSDGLKNDMGSCMENLTGYLKRSDRKVEVSRFIYASEGPFSGTGFQRASELMRMFEDPDIEEIYDVSGGDLANQVLPYLDFEKISSSRAVFWGYSDLSTVINAIYTMTGKKSVLYQVRNLVQGGFEEIQKKRFEKREGLFSPRFEFVQGKHMEGVVVGGNIRCFLKLAGTPYFPDLKEKILLLESLGGEVPQMATALEQLKQMGAFHQVRGVLLGTFTAMEAGGCSPDIITLAKDAIGKECPIARTGEIGHGKDSKGIMIGEYLKLDV